MSKLKKAIFPVGGLGTRFLPATKAMPKEMLPVVDKPIIQYVFEEAIEAGFEEFIFIIGRNKSVIANHFDNSYELQKILTEAEKQSELDLATKWMPKAGSIAFVRQQEPLGLGHAVWCARNFISRDEHFAVLLPDELMQQNCLKQMRKVYEKSGGNVVAVSEVAKHETNKYGIVGLEKGSTKISQMVEKPKPENAPSNLAIIGRYILSGEIFEVLDKGEKGAGGEIQLTDAMAKMLGKQSFSAHKYEGNRFDCGSKAGFLEANIAYALERKDLKLATKDISQKIRMTLPNQLYKTSYGKLATKILQPKILQFLANKNDVVIGFGYTTTLAPTIPNLVPEVLADSASAGQIIVSQNQLPVRDSELDKVLAVHAVENAIELSQTIKELWRILKPEGKLLLIFANKNGYWKKQFTSFNPTLPSEAEVTNALQENNFEVKGTSHALFWPPFMPQFLAKYFEKIANQIYPDSCGLYIIEAQKHLYSPTRGRKVKVTPSLWERITKPKTAAQA